MKTFLIILTAINIVICIISTYYIIEVKQIDNNLEAIKSYLVEQQNCV